MYQMKGNASNTTDTLTQGCLKVILAAPSGAPNPFGPPGTHPIVQVLNLKKLPSSGSGGDRYKMVISDGVHFVHVMTSSNLTQDDFTHTLPKNGLIRMKQYMVNAVSTRKIIIILQLQVLSPSDAVLSRMGNPVALEVTDTGAAPPARQPPQQPQYTASAVKTESSYSAPSFAAVAVSAPAPPVSRLGGDANVAVFPIKSLNPYQNKWTIKARILNKSDIKHWTNAKGEGKLFSLTLGDESGEIRATGFNDAVDSFYEMLQENQVYYISKAAIKVVRNKQFSTVNNEYEMSIDPTTSFIYCADTSSVPGIRYTPIEIAKLDQVEKDAMVDVIAIVREVGDVTSFVSKAQKELKKRELTLVDGSGFSVRMTLWNRVAEQFNAPVDAVLAFKGARVGDFGGRTLSASGTTSMSVNPDIPEAHRLRGWYDAKGRGTHFQTFAGMGGGGGASGAGTPLKWIGQIKDEGLGMNEKPDYAMLQGAISYVKSENVSYPACPSEGCNKKVTEIGSGSWRCEKCDKSYPAPLYRYILTLSISDFTGQTWLQAFNEPAESLLGMSANDLQVIKETRSKTEYDAVFATVLFRMCQFKVRLKAETYQDELKVRSSVMDVSPVSFAGASTRLITLLEAM